MKRTLTLALILALIPAAVLTATGTTEAGATDATTMLPMRYAVPGTAPQDLETATAAVNEAMLDEGLAIEVEVMYIPWDAWDQRTNIMLSTGEPFELMHVMENVLPSQTFAARGAFAPLDDLIEDYGPTLQQIFTDEEWDALRLRGEIYAVPARWTAHHGKGGAGGEISVRMDLLEDAGLDLPRTPEAILDAAEAMQDLAEDKYGETFYIWHHNLAYSDQWYLRSLDTYPFYVDFSEEIIMIDENDNVMAYYESEEFRQVAEFQRKMYERGLRHPDVLSLPREQRSQTVADGKFTFGLSTGGYGGVMSAKRVYPEFEAHMYFLEEDEPVYESLPVWNSNSVPATTDHPQTAIEFLNWLYSSKENHDLFLYGIPGTHYEPVGDNRMEQVTTETGQPLYAHPHWQIQYIPFARFDVDQPDEWIRWSTVPLDNVRYYDNVGFIFDKTPVSTEYSNVLAERQASMWPIKFGIVPYDEYYPDAIRRMRAAGLDRIVEEYEKQYTAWKNSR